METRTHGSAALVGLAAGLLCLALLAGVGFDVTAFLPAAWVVAIASAALYGGLRHGIIWVEHRLVSRGIVLGNLFAIAALMVFGPTAFADADSIRTGRPAVVGGTGYRLQFEEGDGVQTVGVDFGPETTTTPRAPYLAVPGIPRQSDGTHPLNSPIHLAVSCSGPKCSLDLERAANEVRRDYTLGARTRDSDLWQIAGAVDVESGQVLQLRELLPPSVGEHPPIELGEQVESDGETYLERRIPIEVGSESVKFGECSIPFDSDPQKAIYLPVLEFRFLATDDGCHIVPITQADALSGRWLRRAPDGTIDIPSHSFFELRGGRVRWFPLESHNLEATVVEDGEVVVPNDARLEFDAGETIQLSVFQRRFTEVHLGEKRAAECAQNWAAQRTSWFGRSSGTGCRRLVGSLKGLDFTLNVEDEGARRLLEIEIDEDDRDWGHRVFLDLPQSSWESDDGPRRHVLLTGRWPEGASIAGSTSEEVLAVPLRLHGTTPYRAVLTLESNGDDGVVLRIADATRRGEVATDRVAFNLGPPEAQAIVVYERPSSPVGLARAVMWPTLSLAAILVVLLVFGTPIGPVAKRTASVTSILALIVAYSLLQKSLVAYSVVIYPPHDWEAYDQLILSAFVLPFALGLVAALAVATDAIWRKSVRSPRPWLLVAVMLVAAALRLLGTTVGWEAIGPLRFVVLTPLLAALAWVCATATAESAVNEPIGRRQGLLDVTVFGVAALMVVSWWADKGAMLMLGVPVALALVLHAWRLRHGTAIIVTIALGLTSIFLVPREVVRLWSVRDDIQIPALAVGDRSSCDATADFDAAPSVPESCRTTVAAPGDMLGALDRMHLLDTTASVSARRHPLRRLDWLEDGARASDCEAVDRFPTRDAMEVGFFRALVDRYRSEDPSYLRPELLPFSPGVTDALLNDYAGLVTYLPQMPRGTFSTVALMLLAVLLLTLGHGRPWESWVGAAAVGAAGLLTGAGVLTIAANLDVFPNFAQSIPFLALRSHSALVLDALALVLIAFGLSRHRARGTGQAEET